jgi:hypothetical protein
MLRDDTLIPKTNFHREKDEYVYELQTERQRPAAPNRTVAA